MATDATTGARRTGAAVTVALHAVVAAGILAYEPARSAMFAAAPLMVELISPPKVESRPEPPVEIQPPKAKPKPVLKPRPKPPEPEPAPVLAAPAQAVSDVVAPPPPPSEPEPARAPAEPAPPALAPVVPVTAPIFNADYLSNPPPAYPAISRRVGEQGRVVLRVLVNPAGGAAEVQVRDSSGHARLDEAARDTVRRWKFVPAKRGEQAVSAWVLIPISFRLEG
jgi:protein TonB